MRCHLIRLSPVLAPLVPERETESNGEALSPEVQGKEKENPVEDTKPDSEMDVAEPNDKGTVQYTYSYMSMLYEHFSVCLPKQPFQPFSACCQLIAFRGGANHKFDRTCPGDTRHCL